MEGTLAVIGGELLTELNHTTDLRLPTLRLENMDSVVQFSFAGSEGNSVAISLLAIALFYSAKTDVCNVSLPIHCKTLCAVHCEHCAAPC